MKVTIIDGDDESHYIVDVTPEEAKRLETGTSVVIEWILIHLLISHLQLYL